MFRMGHYLDDETPTIDEYHSQTKHTLSILTEVIESGKSFVPGLVLQ